MNIGAMTSRELETLAGLDQGEVRQELLAREAAERERERQRERERKRRQALQAARDAVQELTRDQLQMLAENPDREAPDARVQTRASAWAFDALEAGASTTMVQEAAEEQLRSEQQQGLNARRAAAHRPLFQRYVTIAGYRVNIAYVVVAGGLLAAWLVSRWTA